VEYCTIEYNKWGIFDFGSGNDSQHYNTVDNNSTADYV